MDLEPNKVYKVTKGNTDGSVLPGDLIFINGKSGTLVVPTGRSWLKRYKQTPSVMDFECIHIC